MQQYLILLCLRDNSVKKEKAPFSTFKALMYRTKMNIAALIFLKDKQNLLTYWSKKETFSLQDLELLEILDWYPNYRTKYAMQIMYVE